MSTIEQDSLEHRWNDFQHLDQIRNHWYWRPGWRQGRTFYTWHLTFTHATALHQLSERIQHAIDVPALTMVPDEWLHLTMQGLGFTDDISDIDIDAIVKAVTRRCTAIQQFDITLGPVDPDAEGVGLLITPWQPVVDLRLTVRAGIADIWDHVPEQQDDFRPHVTVAYSAADAPAADIRDRLTPLRDLPPARVHVEAVELIRLNRDEHVYRWDTVMSVPLAR